MQYTIYKPSPSSKGGLVKFYTNKVKNKKDDVWEEVMFAEFVPQKGWDASKRVGSFDPTKKKIVAFTPSEIGEFLYTFDSKLEFNTYHKHGDNGTWIKLVHFDGKRNVWDNKLKKKVDVCIPRFGFTVGDIKVPVEMGEVNALKVLFTSFIKEKMAIDGKESARKFKEYKKTQEAKAAEKTVGREDEVDTEDVPF